LSSKEPVRRLLKLQARVISGNLKGGLLEIEIPEIQGRIVTSDDAKITVDGKFLRYVTKVTLILEPRCIPILYVEYLPFLEA
jgi:hypothetical protein